MFAFYVSFLAAFINALPISQDADNVERLVFCDKGVETCSCEMFGYTNDKCNASKLTDGRPGDFSDVSNGGNVQFMYFVFSASGNLSLSFVLTNTLIHIVGEKTIENVTLIKGTLKKFVLNKTILSIADTKVRLDPDYFSTLNGGSISNPDMFGVSTIGAFTPNDIDNIKNLRFTTCELKMFTDLGDKDHTVLFNQTGLYIDSEEKFYNLSEIHFSYIKFMFYSIPIPERNEKKLTIIYKNFSLDFSRDHYFDIESGSVIVDISKSDTIGNINTLNFLCDRPDSIIFDPFIKIINYKYLNNTQILIGDKIENVILCFGKNMCSIPKQIRETYQIASSQKQLNSILVAMKDFPSKSAYLVGEKDEFEVDLSYLNLSTKLNIGTFNRHQKITINQNSDFVSEIFLNNVTLSVKDGVQFKSIFIQADLGSKVNNIDQIEVINFTINNDEKELLNIKAQQNITFITNKEILGEELVFSLDKDKIHFNGETIETSNIQAQRYFITIPYADHQDIKYKINLTNNELTDPPSLFLLINSSLPNNERPKILKIDIEGNWAKVTNKPLIHVKDDRYMSLNNFPFAVAEYIIEDTRFSIIADQHPITKNIDVRSYICFDDASFNIQSKVAVLNSKTMSKMESPNCENMKNNGNQFYRVINSLNDLDIFLLSIQPNINISELSILNYLSDKTQFTVDLTHINPNIKINSFDVNNYNYKTNVTIKTLSDPLFNIYEMKMGDYFNFIEPNSKSIRINTFICMNFVFPENYPGIESFKIIGNIQYVQFAQIYSGDDAVSLKGIPIGSVELYSEAKDNVNMTFINRGFIWEDKMKKSNFTLSKDCLYTNNFSISARPSKSLNLSLFLDEKAVNTVISTTLFVGENKSVYITIDKSFNKLQREIAILFKGIKENLYLSENKPEKLKIVYTDEEFLKYQQEDDIPIITPPDEPTKEPTKEPSIEPTIVPTKEPDYVVPDELEEMQTKTVDDEEFDISKGNIAEGFPEGTPIEIKFTKKEITIQGKVSSSTSVFYFSPTVENSIVKILGESKEAFGNATFGVKATSLKSTIVLESPKVPLNIISEDENTKLEFQLSDQPENPNQIKFELNELIISGGLLTILSSPVASLRIEESTLYQSSKLVMESSQTSSSKLFTWINDINENLADKIIPIEIGMLELKKGSNPEVGKIQLTDKLILNEGSKFSITDELILKSDKTKLDFKITSGINSVPISNQKPIIKMGKCYSFPLNISISIVSLLDSNSNSAIKLACGKSFSSCSDWLDIISEQTKYHYNECKEIDQEQCLIIKNYESKPGNDNETNNGLKSGEIAGIAIGCIAFVAIIVGIVVYFVVFRKKNKDDSSDISNIEGKDN